MIDYSDGYKKCSLCKQTLPITDFYSRNDRSGRLASRCKKCNNLKSKEYSILNKDVVKEHNHKRYIKNKPYYLVTSAQYIRDNPNRTWCQRTISGHKKKGFDINFTKQELLDLSMHVTTCPICGRELDWNLNNGKGRGGKPNSPSLDRINNEQHMNLSNIQIICNECNRTKGTRTMKEFINYCSVVTTKFKE